MYYRGAIELILMRRSAMHSVVMNFSLSSLYAVLFCMTLMWGLSWRRRPTTLNSLVLTTWYSSDLRRSSYSFCFR